MSQRTTIHLAVPPSLNRYYRTVKGRMLISAAGRSYKTNAYWEYKAARGELFTGRVWVTIKLTPPDRRRRDLDNILKCLLDSLQGCAYLDDGQIDQLVVMREAADPDHPHVQVTIEDAKKSPG